MLSLLLFALVPLVYAQTNGQSFVLCSGGGFLAAGGYAASAQTSGDACATFCRSAKAGAGITDNIYSQYQPSKYTFDTPENCVCLESSQAPVAGNTRGAGPGGNQDCNGAFEVYRETTFEFDQCYSGFTGVGQSTLVTADLSQCFDQCRGSLNLIINVPGNFGSGSFSNGYHCTCASSSVTYGTPGPCDAGDDVRTTTQVFRYTHPPDAAASMLSRRSRRMVNQVPQFCPAGLTACSIASDSDSYECLDTSYELESCGGCLFGEYTGGGSEVKGSGKKKSKAKGVNCYDLGGFGMTCHRGQCIKL